MQEKTNEISNCSSLFRLKGHLKFLLKFLFISIYFYLFLSISLFSQPDSLIRYLGIAAKNNPTVLQRFTEYQAALKKIPQVGSLPDPQLDLGIFITPMELLSGKQLADLRLMQMFPWFGTLKNAKDEMSLMANAMFELFRDTKLQVYYDVQRTWYELCRLRNEISISEQNIELLKVIEQLALIKYKSPAGDVSGAVTGQPSMQKQYGKSSSEGTGAEMQGMPGTRPGQTGALSGQGSASMQSGSMTTLPGGSGLTDLYSIQIETGELEDNIAGLKNQEKVIVAKFNSYLNRPAMTGVYTSEVMLPDTLTSAPLLLPDSVRANNPMLKMLTYEKEAYNARGRMVKAMGYPMMGLGLNYSLIGKSDMSTSTMNGNDMIMPMVSVTLPVYRKKYKAMREEAGLLSQASEQNYQAESNSLNTDYYSAMQLYNDSRRRISLYEKQYTLASRSLEIMMKSYSASSVPLSDILRVRLQALDYELKKIGAITDLNTAKAWIIRLTVSSIKN
jgi:outer membrane protein TolC